MGDIDDLVGQLGVFVAVLFEKAPFGSGVKILGGDALFMLKFDELALQLQHFLDHLLLVAHIRASARTY